MTIFLAWVGGITILALAILGVVVIGVTLSAKADLKDMGPDSWVDDRDDQDLKTWREGQW